MEQQFSVVPRVFHDENFQRDFHSGPNLLFKNTCSHVRYKTGECKGDAGNAKFYRKTSNESRTMETLRELSGKGLNWREIRRMVGGETARN